MCRIKLLQMLIVIIMSIAGMLVASDNYVVTDHGYARMDQTYGIPRVIMSMENSEFSGTPEEIALKYITKYSDFLFNEENIETMLINTLKNPSGNHIAFYQLVNGVFVIDSEIVVSLNNENEITMVTNNYKPGIATKTQPSISEIQALQIVKDSFNESDFKAILPMESQLSIYLDKGTSYLVWVCNVLPESGGDWTFLVNALTGEVIKKENNVFNYVNARGSVFTPDPTTQAHDMLEDILWWDLIAYQSQEDLILNDPESGQYYLRGEYVSSQNILAPDAQPVSKSTPDFLYAWNDCPGFQESNSYYHLDKNMRFIRNLGLNPQWDNVTIDNTKDIVFDAQCTTETNAFYFPSGDYVGYGTCEWSANKVQPADCHNAIIHELGHALHDGLSINSIKAAPAGENRGISEGIADYFTVQYRRQLERDFNLTHYRPNALSNWFGRDLRTSVKSPSEANFSNWYTETDPYVRSITWTSSLMDLENKVSTDPSQGFRLGRECTALLQFSSIGFVSSSNTAKDHVFAMYQADIDMFDGAHLGDLMDVYSDRSLFDDQIVYGNIWYDKTFSGYKLIKSGVGVGNSINVSLERYTNVTIDDTDDTFACLSLGKNSTLSGNNSTLRIQGADAELYCNYSTVKDLKINNNGSIYIENTSIFDNVNTILENGSIDFTYTTGIDEDSKATKELTFENNSELYINNGIITGIGTDGLPCNVNITDGSSLSIGYYAYLLGAILNIRDFGIFNYSNSCLFNGGTINVYNSGKLVFPVGGNYSPSILINAGLGGQIIVEDNSTLDLNSGVLNMQAGSRVILSEGASFKPVSGFTFPYSTSLELKNLSNLYGSINFSKGTNVKTGWQSEVRIKSGSNIKMDQTNLYVNYGSKLVIEFGANLTLTGPMRVIMCPGSKIINRGTFSTSPDVIFTTNIDPTNPDKSLEPWSGVVNEPGSSFTIAGAEFENVQTAINGVGSTVNINGCKFTDCTNGINLSACSKITIANNIFTGNDNGIAVTLVQSDGNVTNNTISNFYKGINVMSCSPTLVQNTISDCYMNGLYVAGNNTYMSMVNPLQIGGTIKNGDELGIDNSELNNTLHNNGIDYVPPPYMLSKASQIYMVSNSNIYLAKGWNNIYSDANQVPCIRTIGLIPEGELPRMQLIYAPENYWGYGPVNDSFFALSLPYYIDYSKYRGAPYGTNPVNANLAGNENAQKLLGKAFGCELDGKYDKAIKEYEKIIEKYPESSEAMVAYAKLPENYQLSNYSFDPLLAVYDSKLANDTSNKKFFKELKVSSHIKAKNYDTAIALSEEMKLEAESEEELILCDIDIALANLLKESGNKGGRSGDSNPDNLNQLIAKLAGGEVKSEPGNMTDSAIPSEIKLYQNYPNPFNPVTQIRFDLAINSDVKLKVYNVSGQVVSELADGVMNAGSHTVDFDGSRLNTGVYYYTLEVNGKSYTQKMILMK